MSWPGPLQRRLALAILITALIPVGVAVWLARSMVRTATDYFYVPEVSQRLDESLDLYQALARSVKTGMRHQATAIASDGELRRLSRERARPQLEQRLRFFIDRYPNVVGLRVVDDEGEVLAQARRARPFDPEREHQLEVLRPLAGEAVPLPAAKEAPPPVDGDVEGMPDAPPPLEEEGAHLEVTLSADKERFSGLEEMSQFVYAYRRLEHRRDDDERSYWNAFAALLGVTIVLAVGVGILLARGVSRRIGDLAEATHRVASGDLSIRVPVRGGDEITDLARAFNRMLGEVEASRARIEYLQRMGVWQEMARRLAHEIKNPLTPIQLAVQELHRRCPPDDERLSRLADETREIVEDEVATLRRLVSEFSEFARLPRAELAEADLVSFLREQAPRLQERRDERDSLDDALTGATLELQLEQPSAPVLLDRQMFRRALVNLVQNAREASGGATPIVLRLTRDGEETVLDVDDGGPGIPEDLRLQVFEPYVTSRSEGTGLGLAIVKKIIVEHGGSVEALASPLGGARLRIRLPLAGTRHSLALLDPQPPPSERSLPRLSAPPAQQGADG